MCQRSNDFSILRPRPRPRRLISQPCGVWIAVGDRRPTKKERSYSPMRNFSREGTRERKKQREYSADVDDVWRANGFNSYQLHSRRYCRGHGRSGFREYKWMNESANRIPADIVTYCRNGSAEIRRCNGPTSLSSTMILKAPRLRTYIKLGNQSECRVPGIRW